MDGIDDVDDSEEIPAELVAISVALDDGTAEGTAQLCVELKEWADVHND